MRILQANKFFYRRGGAEVVFFDTIKGLRARGHEVSEFSVQHSENMPSDYASFFASAMPELLEASDLATQWATCKRLFYSKEIKQKLTALILATEPEVAHLHNIYHHLSASTFLTLRQRRIPMVLTVHDVFPLCPNHSFLHGGRLREDLFKQKLYNCTRYRCIDDRLLPSLAGTLEAYYYRWSGIWKAIRFFICPSQFMADKLIEYGFPAEKMRVIPNPFPLVASALPLGTEIVFLGRLHEEKGIRLFLEAARELRGYPITIAGDGPDKKWAEQYCQQFGMNYVRFAGKVEGAAWQQVMQRAKVIVVPSIFYENCSLAVLEALSYGRLVVGVKRGGTPELIINGQTGFLAAAENARDLARVIKEAIVLPTDQALKITAAARELVARNHNEEQYFTKLAAVYRQAVG